VGAKLPRRSDPNHPDVEWLELNAFLVFKKASQTEFTSVGLVQKVVEDYQQLVRLNRLLEEILQR
jgi:Conserved hypothetical protein (DUF2461)